MRTPPYCAVLSIWLLCLGTGLSAVAAEGHHTLFSAAGVVQQALPKGHPIGDHFTEKRVRTVQLSASMSRPDTVLEGDILTLNLFDDAEYRARVDRVSVNVNGTVAVRARVLNSSYGFVLLSSTNGRTLGSIEIPDTGEHYHIQSAPDGATHYLLELDIAALAASEQPCACCNGQAGEFSASSVAAPGEAAPPAELTPKDPQALAVIDVMVVYTPAARAWADTHGGGIDNVISQAMERANLTLSNSDTAAYMPLVHAAEVDYTESGCHSVDLRRLTATENASHTTWPCGDEDLPVHGFMHEVHAWRDHFGADLVALFASNPGTGGVAWTPNLPLGEPSRGFSITRVQQAATGYTHIHEMGHNLGGGHHKQQNVQPGPRLFSYSAGWRWTGNDDGKYASVMSYSDGIYFEDGITHQVVPHFSDPAIEYAGVATGHPADADNARTVREMKHVISMYRPSAYDYLVAFQAAGGGPYAVLQGNATQLLMAGESTTPVTAFAPSSWPFIGWRLDGQPFSALEQVAVDNVGRNMVLRAHFDEPDTLTTAFTGGTTASGNMFDIEVDKPVFLTGFDVHLTREGSINTLDFFIREGTSFGAENSSEGWQLADSVDAVISGGSLGPTHVDVATMLLMPGQVYGVYVHRAASNDGANIRYSQGGPIEYSTPHMKLTTNCGKDGPAFGATHFPRQWNGRVYYHVIEPPAVASIVPSNAGPTNAESIDFTVTFSSEVFHFDAESDLIIEHSGTAHATVDISGSGTTYTVTVGGISGEGSFSVGVDAESDLADFVGQPLAMSVSSAPIVIDRTPPQVLAITPQTTGPTNQVSLIFEVVFDEAVRRINPATDLLFLHDGTAHDAVFINGSGAVYTVIVTSITGDGTLAMAVRDDGNVRDLAGNPLASGFVSVPVIFDNTPPAAPSILSDFGNGPGVNFTTGFREFELTGTVEEGVVEIRLNGESIAFDPQSGEWSVTVDLESLGPIAQFSLVAIDGAGNESEPASITITYNPLNDADDDGLTDIEEADLAGIIPADPLDPMLPRKVWFVSAAHGDDAMSAMDGGGTENTPWRTIAHAMQQLEPLARENFRLRVSLDDAANATEGTTPIALYEEADLALLPYVAVEPANPGGAPVTIRPPAAGSGPVIHAGHHSGLRDVTISPAPGPGPGRTLLRADGAAIVIERVVFDGLMAPDSTGIHISGPASSNSSIRQSVFRNLGTGILSMHSAAAVADNSFEDIAANGAASRALAIRYTLPAGGLKQVGNAPVLGHVNRIRETGFNRFRGLPAGARALVFLDTPFDITLAQYNDWGVYSEAEIRALISPNGASSVFLTPFIPADKALMPGGVTGLILDEASLLPIALPLGPGAETSQGPFRMAGPGGIFQFEAGALPLTLHGFTAKAVGYVDSDPVLLPVRAHFITAPRFLLKKQGAPLLAASPLQFAFGGAGGSGTAIIRNDGTGTLHWGATAIEGAHWLTLQEQGNRLIITAAWNPGPDARNGLVRISSANASNGPLDVSISQDFSTAWADVNGDGVVNAVDVQLVINAALGVDIEPGFQPDINGDGVVNAVDVQLVINAALGIDGGG